MSVLPHALLWRRVDIAGAEQVTFADSRGFAGRGVAVAAEPVPYACRYELTTDERWTTARFEASVEGAGWLRTVRLERAVGRWRVVTAEQGDLDAALAAAGHPGAAMPGTDDPDRLAEALDVDLWGSPLTNTLPVRRLDLLTQPVGHTVEILAAWVQLPSLAVIASTQRYTLLGPGSVRYASGGFAAELRLDPDGYVIRYPGLAER